MKAAILVFAATLLLGLWAMQPARAGMAVACMDRDEMAAALIDWYGARRAPQSPVAGLEYWVSADSGAWALVDPRGDGTACVMARGLSALTAQDLIAVQPFAQQPVTGPSAG